MGLKDLFTKCMKRVLNEGINPKIEITGLPRSGKSIVLQKVIDMIMEGGGLD